MTQDTTAARIRARFERELAAPREGFVPLLVEGRAAGCVTPERAARLERFPHAFLRDDTGLIVRTSPDTLRARSAALTEVARTLAHEGALSAWRDESYAVAPSFGAAPWFHLERAAARYFGVRTYAAHVNGLVRDGKVTSMWVARRSTTKAIDPGMLDNLVGGGIAADMTVAATVIKESWEEAGIAELVAREAQPTGTMHVLRVLPDGLQDEILFIHDLWLPTDFVPANQDGEAGEHARLPLTDVAHVIARSDGPAAMTVDASLVALTALLREGAFAADAAGRDDLLALLRGYSDSAAPGPDAATGSTH